MAQNVSADLRVQTPKWRLRLMRIVLPILELACRIHLISDIEAQQIVDRLAKFVIAGLKVRLVNQKHGVSG